MSLTVQVFTNKFTPEFGGLYSLAHALVALPNRRFGAVPTKYFPSIDFKMCIRDSIDNAMREAEQAHNELRRFKSELADVRINYDISFEMDGFAKFADFFFDGLIADWYMQSKINSSYESVSNVKNQVTSTIYKLQQMESREKQYLEKLENELKNIIISS